MAMGGCVGVPPGGGSSRATFCTCVSWIKNPSPSSAQPSDQKMEGVIDRTLSEVRKRFPPESCHHCRYRRQVQQLSVDDAREQTHLKLHSQCKHLSACQGSHVRIFLPSGFRELKKFCLKPVVGGFAFKCCEFRVPDFHVYLRGLGYYLSRGCQCLNCGISCDRRYDYQVARSKWVSDSTTPLGRSPRSGKPSS